MGRQHGNRRRNLGRLHAARTTCVARAAARRLADSELTRVITSCPRTVFKRFSHGYHRTMSTPDEKPTLDDVLPTTEEAHPDHREHAKQPHPVDDEELERRTEHEREQTATERPVDR